MEVYGDEDAALFLGCSLIHLEIFVIEKILKYYKVWK